MPVEKRQTAGIKKRGDGMLIIPAVYLLMCLPVYLRADAYVCDTGAGLHVFVGMMGIGVRADIRLLFEDGRLRIVRRQTKGRKRQGPADWGLLRRFLRAMIRRAHASHIAVSAHIGTGDAAATALLAGALQAVLSAAACRVKGQRADIHVNPSYDRTALCLCAGGILLASGGDIIGALIRDAFIERRSEKKSMRRKKGSYGPASDRESDGDFDGEYQRYD